MIEATQDKLREVGFFLRKLIASSEELVGEETEAFPYHLSAFLAAGRSVTFVLQSEEKERYDAWFPSWYERQQPETRAVFDFMKGQRNTVMKRGRADVEHSVEFVSIMRATAGQKAAGALVPVVWPAGGPNSNHRQTGATFQVGRNAR